VLGRRLDLVPSTRWLRRAVGMLALAAALAGAVQAAEKNLPVPRFVTLRSDQVNLRTGPGDRYPIDWVLTRRNMPVEIVAEFSNWRKIRDFDGATGWVQERMVTGRRNVIVRGQIRSLRDQPASDAAVIARAEAGVIAKLLECNPDWCRIEANSVAGWLKREEVWGVYPKEVVQ
jgi:SH3-like domain-containing protein